MLRGHEIHSSQILLSLEWISVTRHFIAMLNIQINEKEQTYWPSTKFHHLHDGLIFGWSLCFYQLGTRRTIRRGAARAEQMQSRQHRTGIWNVSQWPLKLI